MFSKLFGWTHLLDALLDDLFDEEAGFAVSNVDDVEEVTNYLRAFRWAQGQLRDPQGLPISVRLLCEAHRLLLDGVRGAGKQPGELRRSQNWIGGTRPGTASTKRCSVPPLTRISGPMPQASPIVSSSSGGVSMRHCEAARQPRHG